MKQYILLIVTLIFIGSIIFLCALIIKSCAESEAREREYFNSLSYCDSINYRLKNARFTAQIQAVSMEKMAAYQSGECPQK